MKDEVAKAKLSPRILDRYVMYQKALVTIYGDLMATLDRVHQAGPHEQRKVFAELRQRARAEEHAREAAGLELAQVERLDALVADIVMDRKLESAFDDDESLRRLEALVDQLPQDQRPSVMNLIGESRAQERAVAQLARARTRFGNADVDLVLTREAELTASYGALLEKFLGPGGRAAVKAPSSMDGGGEPTNVIPLRTITLEDAGIQP